MNRRVSGSEFHIAGPDTEKARVPNCVLVRWMTAAQWRCLWTIVVFVGECRQLRTSLGQLNTVGTGRAEYGASFPAHFLADRTVWLHMQYDQLLA